ncbi:MAG: SBBP repeat-containing protein, partial [Chitinophagales bacterium]
LNKGTMGWRSLLSLLLALLLLGSNPALLSAGTINWIPEGQITGLATDNSVTGVKANKEQKAKAENMLADMPLFFIENQGQVDKQVLYYTEGGNQGLYFTPSGLTFTLTKAQTPSNKNIGPEDFEQEFAPPATEQERWAVKLDFIGANNVKPHGEGLTPTKISYFKGQPEDWKTGLKTYSRIVYPELWPGIDLVFKGGTEGLKYEFMVAPGADPKQIKLAWQGAETIKINQQGGMEINTPIGGFTDQAPIVWQVDGDNRQTVDACYYLSRKAENTQAWGFKLGSYDPTREMIIDPVVIDYCGYIGGSDSEKGNAIAVDSTGRAYVTGTTESTEGQGFPLIGGPDSSFNSGYEDAFVARIAADGTYLEYCGYIGGSSYDYGRDIAVDSNGRAYVTGYTSSSEATFPVKVGPDLTYNGGDTDSFVARVAADGSSLEYCGYIGGSDREFGSGIAVDDSGRAFIIGSTCSSSYQGFPVKVGPYLTFHGDYDCFVARVASDGNSLDYCGYIGGQGVDEGCDIAIDSSGRAYVVGSSCLPDNNPWPSNFPVIGGLDSSNNGDYDAFVARVAADGASLEYCGYIGGSSYDYGISIAIDSSGRAYTSGYTASSERQGFPIKEGPDRTFNGEDDAFVARVAADGNSLEYCGYIGGSASDEGKGIAVDSNGRAYVTGYAWSSKMDGSPAKAGPNLNFNGSCDAFVARIAADGTSLEYCGYVGGSGEDHGTGVAVDSNGKVYVIGDASSSETQGFPIKAGPDLTHNGYWDVFVARIRDPYSDLAVVLQNPPGEIASGEKTTITAVVSSMGETAGNASAQFYIDNQLLSTKNISGLKPGKSKQLKVKVKVPATVGLSTLKVELIPTNQDINLNYNTAENQVKILGPDLTVKTVAPKKALEPGKSGTLTVGIANQTIATAGEFVVRVYRVNGGSILGEKKVSKLKGQQEKALSVKIKVPADFQPNEYIRVEIDASGQVAEENEGNNTRQYPPPAP